MKWADLNRDWAYEELREKMAAELPPRTRGEEEDPRITRLRVVLRKGGGLNVETWAAEMSELGALLEEARVEERDATLEDLT